MRKSEDVLRPLALTTLAGGLFIWMLWLNVMCLDESASKFALSDKVLRLHRLTNWLLLAQLVLTLGLVLALELVIAARRTPVEAEHHSGG